MATKAKKVTYRDPADDNADYLEPLQYDPKLLVSTRSKPAKKPPAPGGLFGSIFFPISLLLYVGIPLSQFVIGLIYIGQCTVRQFIAFYMILSGIFGILLVIIGIIIHMQIRKQAFASYDAPRPNPLILRILIPIFILLFLFVIAWFIAGHVIVLEVKLSVEFFDPTLPEYCHGNLYKPAYILIFVDYLILLIVIILSILSCIAPPDNSDNKKPKRPTTRNTRK